MSLNPFDFLFENRASLWPRTLRHSFWQKVKDAWTVFDGESNPHDNLRLIYRFSESYENFEKQLFELTKNDTHAIKWRSFLGFVKLYLLLLIDISKAFIQNVRPGLLDFFTFRLPSLTTFLILPLIGMGLGFYFAWDKLVRSLLSIENPWIRLALSVVIPTLFFPTVIEHGLMTLVAAGLAFCMRKAAVIVLTVFSLPIVGVVHWVSDFFAKPKKAVLKKARILEAPQEGSAKTLGEYMDKHQLSLDEIVLTMPQKETWLVVPKRLKPPIPTWTLFMRLLNVQGRQDLLQDFNQINQEPDYALDSALECKIEVDKKALNVLDDLNVPISVQRMR